MKIVVIGGSGLIGSKLVTILRGEGHEVIAASPSTGVNTLTGEGLAEAFSGADVVVDVANSPSFEDAAVLQLLRDVGAQHARRGGGGRREAPHCAVGRRQRAPCPTADISAPRSRRRSSSRRPLCPTRSCAPRSSTSSSAPSRSRTMRPTGSTCRRRSCSPSPPSDVSAALADVAVAPPVNGTIEIAGPEPIGLDKLVRRLLEARGDERRVITDADALYFGAPLNDQTLTPAAGARLGPTHFADWLSQVGNADVARRPFEPAFRGAAWASGRAQDEV